MKMESNHPLSPNPRVVENHIEFYENKAMNELKAGNFEEAAQSYAAAAKICQSLEDLENAQVLFAKSSETFWNIDPQQAHNMRVQARQLSQLTGLTFEEEEVRNEEMEEEEEVRSEATEEAILDSSNFSDSSLEDERDCRSLPEYIMERIKSCFDKE